MSRLGRLKQELMLIVRGWFAKRRLNAETMSDLVGTVNDLRQQVAELQLEIDEVRADSRRVAELRIQVEDLLADRA